MYKKKFQTYFFKFFLVSLTILPFNAMSLDSINQNEIINKLSKDLCINKFDKDKCYESLDAIISISIYKGYLAGICGKSAGRNYAFDSKCDKAREEIKELLKNSKINNTSIFQ